MQWKQVGFFNPKITVTKYSDIRDYHLSIFLHFVLRMQRAVKPARNSLKFETPLMYPIFWYFLIGVPLVLSYYLSVFHSRFVSFHFKVKQFFVKFF